MSNSWLFRCLLWLDEHHMNIFPCDVGGNQEWINYYLPFGIVVSGDLR